MRTNETDKLTRKVSRIYQHIDRKTSRLQRTISLYCPEKCGACCNTQDIEATLLETLPLAEAILDKGVEELILETVESRLSMNDFSCILFRPSDDTLSGCCTYYPFRPLLCRLFGFSARKNRHGEPEFSCCKRIREISRDRVRRAEVGVSMGLCVPVFQESFMRIAAMHPVIGFQRRPINLAIKEALEYLHWRRPGKVNMAKAS